jgi:geranylgeranyl diphosphate synthase, type II
MQLIKHYQQLIDLELAQLAYNNEPAGLYDPIKYVLGIGGKRIRPAVCMAVCHFFSGSGQASLNAALGLEIFHNFTLLHDDIMDHAVMRRNVPTVHVKWNPNTAILSGDAMMVLASELMLDVPEGCLVNVQRLFLRTARQVCEGQQYDMEFENRSDVSTQDYLEMIRLKTAVLLAASLQIGALIGGASEDDAIKLYQFGQDLGLAFQLQDDYLDAFGNEADFGKRIGGDIVSNKKTFLLLSCLERCNSRQLAELRGWLNALNFDEVEKIDAVKKLYNELNVGGIARDLMNKYYSDALQMLDQLALQSEWKAELKNFAEKLINRSR